MKNLLMEEISDYFYVCDLIDEGIKRNQRCREFLYRLLFLKEDTARWLILETLNSL